jgi:hypothetical protein
MRLRMVCGVRIENHDATVTARLFPVLGAAENKALPGASSVGVVFQIPVEAANLLQQGSEFFMDLHPAE